MAKKRTKVRALKKRKQRLTAGWLKLEPEPGAQCSRCGRGYTDVRLDWDDAGYICKRCYLYAGKCEIKGCENIEIRCGLCRAHEVGDLLDDEGYRQLAEANGHYANSTRVEPNPGAGYGADFRDAVAKSLRSKFNLKVKQVKAGPLVYVTGEKK